jgi:uncharacterized protein YjiS (DUF1127 family)
MHTPAHRPDPVAPAHRWQGFGRIGRPTLFSTVLRHLVALAARGFTDQRQVRRERANDRALRELDDRTLRDLGLTRGEIASLGAELGGVAEPTRVWAQRVRRNRYC